MNRPLLLLAALVVAAPAFAVKNASAPPPGARIGVLRMSERYSYGAQQTVAKTVQKELRTALHARGYEAFDARTTFDALSRAAADNADYYVEIVSSHGANQNRGGVGIGAARVGAEISVVVSEVAAEVRLYDGKTLELVDRFSLSDRNTAFIPTAIGVRGVYIAAAMSLPFVQYAQYRSVARSVARQAASLIAGR